MLTKIPSGARKKVIPIIHQGNVRNIKRKLVLAPVMITILNAIRLNGVPITGIIHKPVRCRPLLTDSVRTASLITKDVKKTGRVPAGNPDMSTPVLRDGCINQQTVVRGTALTANAVPLRPRPVVRQIIR